MPKIGEVRITLVASKNEDIPPVTIVRGLDKMWKVEYAETVEPNKELGQMLNSMTYTKERGLFPSEVKLANELQEKIINVFNNSQAGGDR